MDKLEDRLNELWAGIIESYKFDILNHTITFNIKTIYNEVEKKYNVKLKGVSSYHFYEGMGEERINLPDYDEECYLELTSIDYFEDGMGYIRLISDRESYCSEFYSNANIRIEMWSSMLFVEANSIVFNDVDEYKLKVQL